MMILVAACFFTVVLADGQVPCSIPGPRNLSHSVAIIGAGPAGIHMALKLKEKGEILLILPRIYIHGGA